MKVKNIVFSGFAAAILAGVSGAHAADPVTPYNLATTEYVTKQTNLKQDKLSADNAAAPITISVDESGKATIGADLVSTLAPYAKTADVETTLAGYATKDDLDGALDEGGALTEAVDTAVKSAIQEAVTSGEIGNAITDAVKNKADTSYVDGQLAKKQGLMVAGDNVTFTTDDAGNTVVNADDVDLTPYATTESVTNITNALDGRVTANTNDIAGLKTADTQLGGRIDTIEGKGYQTAGDVETALEPYAKTADLDNYATTGDLSAVSAVANAADTLSKSNKGEIDTLKAADTGLDERIDAIEGAGYQTAGDVETALAPYAKTETVAATYATKGEIPSLEGLATETYAQQQAAAVQTAIDGAKYVSGKDVAAGTYLITTDGAGTYTWTSVKIVNE